MTIYNIYKVHICNDIYIGYCLHKQSVMQLAATYALVRISTTPCFPLTSAYVMSELSSKK